MYRAPHDKKARFLFKLGYQLLFLAPNVRPLSYFLQVVLNLELCCQGALGKHFLYPSLVFLKDLFGETAAGLTESLETTTFSRAATKLRSNKTRHKKKVCNLEGILAIQGELITEAANYDPLGEVLLTVSYVTGNPSVR